MRVLVTGGTGRLGRSVVRELATRHEVLVIARGANPSGPANVMPVDCLDLGQVCGAIYAFRPDALVHLAAIAVPQRYPDEITFRTNTALDFNAFRAAAICGVPRVIYAGSVNPLGLDRPDWRPDYLPIDEGHRLSPWHAYGLTKAIGEEVAHAFVRGGEGRLRVVILRPLFVVAPEEWNGDQPTQRGDHIADRLGDPASASRNLFNYVDARDAAQAFRLALEALDDLPNGEAFYVGASDALAEHPLVELLPRLHPDWGSIAERLTETRPAISIEKAQRLLGYAPRHSWRTELRRTSHGDASRSKSSGTRRSTSP